MEKIEDGGKAFPYNVVEVISAHTPGPWAVQTNGIWDVLVVANGTVCQINNKGTLFHMLDGSGSTKGRSQKEMLADAFLIAAAPDLLAALESIARIDISEVGAWEKVAGRMQATALEAIEKATGGLS